MFVHNHKTLKLKDFISHNNKKEFNIVIIDNNCHIIIYHTTDFMSILAQKKTTVKMNGLLRK